MLGFVLASFAWIYSTDLLVHDLGFGAETELKISVLKGIFYVTVVAVAIGRTRLHVAHLREEAVNREEEANFEMLRRLAKTAEYRDEAAGLHNQRIGLYAETLAKRLGISSDSCRSILLAATLHDVGKIAVPDAVLLKPGRLSDDERRIIQSHVTVGHAILADSAWSGIEVARKIARHHHENWDGSGYPDGLSRWSIPMEARIVSVCDVFDALLSERPYKQAWPWDEAVDEIRSLSGVKFDPSVVAAFCDELPALKRIWLRLPG